MDQVEVSSRLEETSHAPVVSQVQTDPADRAVEFQLKKAIAVHLKSRGRPFFTQQFLDMLAPLATEYLHNLCVGLRTDMELQRRHQPSLADTEVLFQCQNIKVTLVYEEALLNKKIYRYIKYDVDRISQETERVISKLGDGDYSLNEDDPSYLFFTNESYEIAQLVPTTTHRPKYIPSYFPELPPDYTFQHTPEYINTITDLKRLRVNLVEESRVAEKLLYNLIEDDKNDDDEMVILDSDSLGLGEEESELPITDVEPPIEPAAVVPSTVIEGVSDAAVHAVIHPNSFDIVKYAQLRTRISERRRRQAQKWRHQRQLNPFIQMERHFLPYATEDNSATVAAEFDAKVTEGFKLVIRHLRKQKVAQNDEIARVLAEKQKAMEKKKAERERLDFAFTFDNNHYLLDLEDEFDLNKPDSNAVALAPGLSVPGSTPAMELTPALESTPVPESTPAPEVTPALQSTSQSPLASTPVPSLVVPSLLPPSLIQGEVDLEHELDAALFSHDDMEDI